MAVGGARHLVGKRVATTPPLPLVPAMRVFMRGFMEILGLAGI